MARCNAKNKQDLDEARSRVSMLENELTDARGQLAEALLPPPPSPDSTGVLAGGQKQRMALREQCTALDASLQEVWLCVLEALCASAVVVLLFEKVVISKQASRQQRNIHQSLKN
jgi:hypothetical protein